MTDIRLILILKVVMSIGVTLILIGLYLHLFSPFSESLGTLGIVISAGCVAFGMILSLPTKMFITFIWVKREMDMNKHKLNQ